jgi:hypothetical protein
MFKPLYPIWVGGSNSAALAAVGGRGGDYSDGGGRDYGCLPRDFGGGDQYYSGGRDAWAKRLSVLGSLDAQYSTELSK